MDRQKPKLEDSHIPLIVMTILTQVSLGGFFALFLGDLLSLTGLNLPEPTFLTAVVVLLPAALGLPLSALHLGRPFKALTALKKVNSSWLSREGWGLGIFTFGMTVVALLYLLDISRTVRFLVEIIVLLAGLFGIYAQSMIYRVEARPSWNRVVTTKIFFGVGYIGILLFGFMALLQGQTGLVHIMVAVALLMGLAQIYSNREHDNLFEDLDDKHPAYAQLDDTRELLMKHSGIIYRSRHWLLYTGAVALPLFVIILLAAHLNGPAALMIGIALITGTASEYMGRYLFFTTVVPLRLP